MLRKDLLKAPLLVMPKRFSLLFGQFSLKLNKWLWSVKTITYLIIISLMWVKVLSIKNIEILRLESLTAQIGSAFCPCCLPSEVGFAQDWVSAPNSFCTYSNNWFLVTKLVPKLLGLNFRLQGYCAKIHTTPVLLGLLSISTTNQ